MFHAEFYIRVRRVDKLGQRGSICGRSGFQLHMTHELAGTLQQTRRIGQGCTVEETDVYVRGEDVDVAERRVSQTSHRTAIVQKLPHFIAAFSHRFEPRLRDGSQFNWMLSHPGIDGRVALDRAIEPQQIGSARRRATMLSVSVIACHSSFAAARQLARNMAGYGRSLRAL